MKTPIPTRIVAGFVLAIILLSLFGIYLRREALEFRQYREDVAHSLLVLDAIKNFRAAAAEAESGQRGFLLTGIELYLSPYNIAAATVEGRLAHLEQLTKDDPTAVPLVQQLRVHTAAKFAELADTIQKRRNSGFAAALAVVNTNVGENEMEAILRLADELGRGEGRRQQLSEIKYAAGIAKTKLLFTSTIALQLIGLLLLFISVRNDFQHRAEAQESLQQGQSSLSAILNTIGDGLKQLDANGKLVYMNPAGQTMLGYELREMRGCSMHELVHARRPDGSVMAEQDCPLAAACRNGVAYRNEEDWFQRKDGSFIKVLISSAPLVVDGKIQGAVVSFSDVTESHRLQAALRKSEERYRSLVEKSSGLICTHDLEGNIISVNQAAAAVLGYRSEELIGQSLLEIMVPDRRGLFPAYLAQVKEKGESSGLMKVRTRNGRTFIWSYANRLVDEGDGKAYVIGYSQDVTAQMEAQAELQEHRERLAAALAEEKSLSRSDALTKLANRRAFEEVFDRECRRARRYKRPITLAYLDLDDFKRINDEQGHQKGDEVLIDVAATLRANLRDTDLPTRMGGDEFVVMLPETAEDGARGVMTKLNRALQNLVRDKGWAIGFTFGVITFPVPLDSIDEMLRHADDLMYQVKRHSKGATMFRSVDPGKPQAG